MPMTGVRNRPDWNLYDRTGSRDPIRFTGKPKPGNRSGPGLDQIKPDRIKCISSIIESNPTVTVFAEFRI